MIPAAFDYHRATSTEEAIGILADNPNAKLLAGGHSLLPMMRLRLANPTLLVDIGGIAALRGIRDDGDDLVIGALATHAEIAAAEAVAASHAAVAEAAASIGDVQVRNCGTLGGSLAHADPAADYAAAVTACDAVVEVAGRDGDRSIPVDEFFAGVLTTNLRAHEIVTAVRFPAAATTRSAYGKFAQPASGFAVVGVAAALEQEDGVCTAATLAATGVADRPRRLPAAATLIGKPLDEVAFAACAAAADEGMEDVRRDRYASEDYRRHLLRVLTGRVLRRAAAPAAEKLSTVGYL